MKYALSAMFALVGFNQALAHPFHLHKHFIPDPVPAPDLAVGVPATLTVIGAYLLARMVIRQRGSAGVEAS